MNEPKSLKSFSEIGLKIKNPNSFIEAYEADILAVFGEEIAKQITHLEYQQNKLLIELQTVAHYSAIMHQKTYFLNQIQKVIGNQVKIKIEKLIVTVSN